MERNEKKCDDSCNSKTFRLKSRLDFGHFNELMKEVNKLFYISKAFCVVYPKAGVVLEKVCEEVKINFAYKKE